ERVRFGILLEALEALGQPRGDRGATARGEPGYLLEAVNGLDARNDRRRNPRGPRALDEAEVICIVEEHLRDGARRARIELALEIVDVRCPVRALRVLLRIRSDGNVEIAERADACDQFRSAPIP